MHDKHLSTPNSVQLIGPSILRIESPNTCIVTYVGDLDVGVIEKMNSALITAAQSFHPLYLVVNLSRTRTVTQLGRRHGAGGLLALNPAATAVIAGSFHMRVVVEMVTKAAKLLNAGLDGPVEFFANEKEARAWIIRQQKNRLATH